MGSLCPTLHAETLARPLAPHVCSPLHSPDTCARHCHRAQSGSSELSPWSTCRVRCPCRLQPTRTRVVITHLISSDFWVGVAGCSLMLSPLSPCTSRRASRLAHSRYAVRCSVVSGSPSASSHTRPVCARAARCVCVGREQGTANGRESRGPQIMGESSCVLVCKTVRCLLRYSIGCCRLPL